MRTKMLKSPLVLAVALCSIMLLAAYAIAQTTSDNTNAGQTQQSTDQSGQVQSTDQGSMGAGTGAGPSQQAPAGSVTVPEGQPCPPGTEPAQPSQGAGAGAGATQQQPEGSIQVPAGQPCPPGYVPSQPSQPSQPAEEGAGPSVEEQPQPQPQPQPQMGGMQPQAPSVMHPRAHRAAGVGAGPYYRRGYLPRAGVDFGSLAMLGSTLVGAGLAIRRRRK